VYQGEVICIEKEKLDRFSLSSLIKYYISEDKIIEEMKGAGYYLVIKYDFIPDQSFTIFSPYS